MIIALIYFSPKSFFFFSLNYIFCLAMPSVYLKHIENILLKRKYYRGSLFSYSVKEEVEETKKKRWFFFMTDSCFKSFCSLVQHEKNEKNIQILFTIFIIFKALIYTVLRLGYLRVSFNLFLFVYLCRHIQSGMCKIRISFST